MSDVLHWYTLGHMPVQSGANKIVVPESVIAREIALPDRSIYWGVHRPTQFIVLTRNEDLLIESENYRRQGQTGGYSLPANNRAVRVPKEFFPEDFEGSAVGATAVDEELAFTPGETRWFVSNDRLEQKDVCLVMRDDQYRGDFSGEWAGGALPDGGEVLGDEAAPTIRDELEELDEQAPMEDGRVVNPEAYVQDGVILDNSTGRLYRTDMDATFVTEIWQDLYSEETQWASLTPVSPVLATNPETFLAEGNVFIGDDTDENLGWVVNVDYLDDYLDELSDDDDA